MQTQQIFTFYGAAQKPLLAPRGVFVSNNKLVISDTGNNRIMIWNKIPEQANQAADIVLGQADVQANGRNGGHSVNAATLQYPSGIWTNGDLLIVADAWNHRVLIWHRFPTTSGQVADVVIGQENFNTNLPNKAGVAASPTAQTLYWPYGVFSDGKQLWIADTGNRRVLFYDTIPTANFASADKVIGQNNFNEKDYNPANAIWPYAVKVSANGSLLISDTQYARCLLWHDWEKAFDEKADVIIGQKNFEDNGANQYQYLPSANTLNWCYDGCFINNALAIADTGNSRVLLFHSIPNQHNASAESLMGQAHFEVNGESNLSMKTTASNEMYWPFAINSYDNHLVIADTGNHRILFYKVI